MRWQDLIETARLLTTTPHPNTQPLQVVSQFEIEAGSSEVAIWDLPGLDRYHILH